MPNARIMIHQPLGGASGQAVDIEIQAKEIMYHKANLNRIMADYCGQPIEQVSLYQCLGHRNPVIEVRSLWTDYSTGKQDHEPLLFQTRCLCL